MEEQHMKSAAPLVCAEWLAAFHKVKEALSLEHDSPSSSNSFTLFLFFPQVHVFDLNINKFEALCQQAVVANTVKLTHVEFNPIYPIIIVGDERGIVTSLKLSPNLRKRPKVRLLLVTNSFYHELLPHSNPPHSLSDLFYTLDECYWWLNCLAGKGY